MPHDRWRDLALSVSLANLCFAGVWHLLIFAEPFFLPAWGWIDLVAITLNVGLLSAVFWALLRLGRKENAPPLFLVFRWLPMLAIVVLLDLFRLRHERALQERLDVSEVLLLGIVLAALALYLLWRWPQRLRAWAELLALWLVAFVPVTFVQAAWRVAQSDAGLEPTVTEAARPHPNSSGRRVLWLVFDEMDVRPAFVERPDSLQLPELDRLRTQSLTVTQAHQAGTQTAQAMTSILLGRQVYQLRPQGKADFWVGWDPGKEPDVPFRRQPNLLRRARQAGLLTAVVGWYLPYCRLLGGDLSHCTWQSMDAPARSQDPGLREIMLGQLSSLLPLAQRRHHLAQYRALLHEARKVVTHPGPGLFLVHLPPPHEPAIYDRRRGDFTLWNFRHDWYLDNLALVDRTVGELRRAMEQAGVWEETAVLVTADHSLRYYRNLNPRTDPRVPFLLKLPGHSQGVEYAAPVHALLTHDLIRALINGELANPEAAVRWLEAHARSDAARNQASP